MKIAISMILLLAVITACSSNLKSEKLTAFISKPDFKFKKVSKTKINKKASRGIASSGLTPNSSRYKDTGAKPELGRSGDNSIQTRAIMSKDGNTVVEVTTGNFASGPKVGTTLTKVQLKTFKPNGDVLEAQNFNDLANDGYFTTTSNTFFRHQKVQIQANLKKDSSPRTFVLTTDSKVYRRPDLKVNQVQAISKLRVNEVTQISAEITELNADLSAAADCVMKIDQQEVARTQNIFIDKGDTVICNFNHAFTQPGSYEVSISVDNVRPTDWDLDNNSAQKTIEVVSP